MASSAYVEATWVGAPNHQLPTGLVLEPGKTVVNLPRGEAEASDNWKIKGTGKEDLSFQETGVDRTVLDEETTGPAGQDVPEDSDIPTIADEKDGK